MADDSVSESSAFVLGRLFPVSPGWQPPADLGYGVLNTAMLKTAVYVPRKRD